MTLQNDQELLSVRLRDAIQAFIEHAEKEGIGPIPTNKYTVHWWERSSPTEKTGVRDSRSELKFWWDPMKLMPKLAQDERMAAFESVLNDFISKHAINCSNH